MSDLIERLEEYRRQDPYRASAGLAADARAELDRLRRELEKRAKQLGVACDKHDLTHALACGRCLAEARELLHQTEDKCVVLRSELAALRTDHLMAVQAMTDRQLELNEAQRDAARYRWLRDVATTGDWCELGGVTAKTMELAIDAALAEPKEVQP